MPDFTIVPTPDFVQNADALSPALERPVGSGEVEPPKLKKKKKRSKGVETLFRTTLASHLKLSEMADRKANLMISINAILISLTLSSLVKPADRNEALFVPSLLLVGVCLITIVVALMVTNPTLSSKPTAGVPKGKRADLLFFDGYVHLTAPEYRRSLRALIADEENLYNSLIDNIYAQGRVLSRKYRLLRFAYGFFMVGFSTAILCALQVLIFGPL